MVTVLNPVTLAKDTLADCVEIIDVDWEPWHFSSPYLLNINRKVFNLLQNLDHIFVSVLSNKVNVNVHSLAAMHVLRRLALNVRQLDVVVGQ
jgi:hypothetical protein